MLELGWAGKDASTAVADVTAAAKTVPIEVTIAQWTNPETNELREWSTVRNVGSFSAPLAPLEANALKDVNGWLTEIGNGDIPF